MIPTSTSRYLSFPSDVSHITNRTSLVHHRWRGLYACRERQTKRKSEREREKWCYSEGRVINVLSGKSVLFYCIFLLSSSSHFLFLSVVYWLLRLPSLLIIGLARRHEDASGNWISSSIEITYSSWDTPVQPILIRLDTLNRKRRVKPRQCDWATHCLW